MSATTRAQYWNELNTTRKCLLVLGMTIMSPIVAALLLIAGTNEAYKSSPRQRCKGGETVEYIDIAQVKRLNQEKGEFFFTEGATRFFQSRYPKWALREGNKAYFVTSEQFESSQGERAPRLYTVRVCDMKTGDIDTVGEFQQYRSSSQAYKTIKVRIE